MIIEITSPTNDKIKYIKSLALRKNRVKYKQYTVEGLRSVEDALNAADVDMVVLTRDMSEKLVLSGKNVIIVSDAVFKKISETESPQGVLAVVNMTETKESFNPDGAYVYCDNIRDPGNLGTIIRTADAAGFNGVILSPDTVDVYNQKVVRSSMGSFFRTKIFEGIELRDLSGFKIFGGILDNDTIDYRRADYSGGIVIAVGNEANGIGDENKKLCIPVMIPIYGGAESLNAAVAASILMYEAANARGGNKE